MSSHPQVDFRGAFDDGPHVLKTWSSVQSTMARSSGEAELYAMLKAASSIKYMMSLASDFSWNLSGEVKVDATAAIGITKRSGLGGRTRHVQVQHLWIQDEVAKGALEVNKVGTADNFADIFTKPVAADTFYKHLKSMGFTFPD